MRHYYLGVEHLFIALLDIKGGLTSRLLMDEGFVTDYVIDAIRRKVGKGGRHRLWPGIPNTPRTEVILSIANEIALESGHQSIYERDLLLAIIDEKDNIPVRVLQQLGIQLDELRESADRFDLRNTSTSQTFVKVDFAPGFSADLNKDELFLLRRMFHGYLQVRINMELRGGYSASRLLVVTPIRNDNREDSRVVVKIGRSDSILDEARRYEQFVKNTLPPLTARLEDKPTAPDSSDLAALKYTFATSGNGLTQDLRMIIHDWPAEQLGRWLTDRLFPDFGANWWKQSRLYRFQAWQEYDWVLPPLLTLRYMPLEQDIPDAFILRNPVKRSRVHELQHGDAVVVENFVIDRVVPETHTIRLTLGYTNNINRACQIELTDVDFSEDTYYRGEIVERIAGRIWQTRDEQLSNAARSLEPDFDPGAETIPMNGYVLPNPLLHLIRLLDLSIEGNLSTIHGDLHLGNILLGPGNTPLLIDFARTRDGHTIFDWTTLEVSMIAERIVPLIGPEWADISELIGYFITFNQPEQANSAPAEIAEALQIIRAMRNIAEQCLARADHWEEYFVSLALASLRSITWDTMTLPARRFMFLYSALSIHEYYKYLNPGTHPENTPSPDATDYLSNI